MSANETSNAVLMADAPSNAQKSIGRYLLDRLAALGIRHIFGIPGDYVLTFFKMIEESPIEIVVNTNELAAGYAADAYARLNGIGAACVTYAVGGFSLTNAMASAYAEKSPVVVISGSPAARELKRSRLLHHMVGGPATQHEVFQKLTVASCVLDDPLTAFREIDRVLAACLRYKRPVYIEIPRDKVHQMPVYPHYPVEERPVSDENELREAITESIVMLRSCRKPVIVAGIELARFGLQQELLRLAEAYQIPFVSTLMSKSVIRERHPLFAGTYLAAMGRPPITKLVEESDCVVMLGALITDVDTGIFTHNIDESRLIFATSEQVRIRYHHYENILLSDFISALANSPLPTFNREMPKDVNPVAEPYTAVPGQNVTTLRLLQQHKLPLPHLIQLQYLAFL